MNNFTVLFLPVLCLSSFSMVAALLKIPPACKTETKGHHACPSPEEEESERRIQSTAECSPRHTPLYTINITCHPVCFFDTSFIYLQFYIAFNTLRVISRRVVERTEETSTYGRSRFCTVNYRPTATTSFPT